MSEASAEYLKQNQGQLDADGIMVAVSRQALDETLTYLTELEAALAERQWIPVSERLPNDNVRVLVDGGIGYYRSNDFGGTWYTITALEWPGKQILWDVTHWMPLSTPPAQEKE